MLLVLLVIIADVAVDNEMMVVGAAVAAVCVLG